MARLAGDAGVGTVWGVPTVSESSLPAMPVALDREGSPETPMNHTECGRCGAEFGGITPLLEHYQEVHGGVPKPRFRDMEEVREVVPDQTRADEQRRMSMVHYYHRTGRLLGGKWAS